MQMMRMILKNNDYHGYSLHLHIIRIFALCYYQDDFFTPGIKPLLAISLKQILHNPKSLINPWLRPHLKQRFSFRELYLGFLFAFAISDFLAIML